MDAEVIHRYPEETAGPRSGFYPCLSVMFCGRFRCLVRAGGVGVVCGEAEAAPGVGYDDAVAGVVEVVADLDGQVGADVADVFGEGGDVLGALVGDAGDAVVVDEEAWGVGGVVRLEGCVGDGAVGDAAHGSEAVAALALDLFGGGFLAPEDIAGYRYCSGSAHRDGGDSTGRAEGERQLR